MDSEPSVGGEIRKKRPAVIISNDAANKYLNRMQVVPLTSKVGRVYPCEAVVMLNDEQSKAMADQLTTVSKQRLVNQMGRLPHTACGRWSMRLKCNSVCWVQFCNLDSVSPVAAL